MRDLMCAEGMAEGGGRRAAGGAAGEGFVALPLSNSFPKISNHPHTTPKFKNE